MIGNQKEMSAYGHSYQLRVAGGCYVVALKGPEAPIHLRRSLCLLSSSWGFSGVCSMLEPIRLSAFEKEAVSTPQA